MTGVESTKIKNEFGVYEFTFKGNPLAMCLYVAVVGPRDHGIMEYTSDHADHHFWESVAKMLSGLKLMENESTAPDAIVQRHQKDYVSAIKSPALRFKAEQWEYECGDDYVFSLGVDGVNVAFFSVAELHHLGTFIDRAARYMRTLNGKPE